MREFIWKLEGKGSCVGLRDSRANNIKFEPKGTE